MLRVNPASIFEHRDPNGSPKLVLRLALITALCFLWTGCNTLTQSSASSTSGQSAPGISIQSSLPGAGVGTSYHAVLSVSGGAAPYHFAVSQGVLPPGLTLNPQTGSISGIPTQTGSFSFTITVTGESFVNPSPHPDIAPSGGAAFGGYVSVSGARAYTVAVGSSDKSVSVQISPADPSIAPGGKIQFSAVVTNTSNTAVTWAASAGTISAGGLFSAPASGSAKSITVTASSLAASSAQASTAVTISGSTQFTITTTSVPAAVEATAYSASLTASGGQLPYQWSILSGSLPPGLQLASSTGTLSGSATKAGTFTFSVRSTDAASHTAQQSLSLFVSTSGRTCGPPAYNCSRTDFDIVQIPSSIPNVGNLVGANTIVTDPDFGNRIVRITDWNTDPGQPAENRSFVSAASGSADENLWNLDSTLFILQSLGDDAYPFTFDSSTLQAARMYGASYPSTAGLKLPNGGIWSRVNPNLLYTDTGTVISKYDFTDRTQPPSAQPVYDFTSSPNCLPAGFSVTWKSKGGISAGDTVLGMAYSNTGNQGTGVYAVAYKVGSGCTMLNTQTGQVKGDWGAKGVINIPDRWTIHNVKQSKDGNWLVIATAGCLSSNCSHGPYFWQIGTTNVSSCGDGKTSGQRCGGHWTEGYTHWVNNYDSGKQVSRPLSEAANITYLNLDVPSGIEFPLDEHASWNNADPDDTLPFFLTYWSTISPFPSAWYNEITGVAPDGSGKVWRFAHNFITGQSQIFSTEYGIGSVSQDGRFFIFSSDWMGTLGSQSDAAACTVGKNCRGDVFVLELN
jgi:hypothetical protein